MSGAKFCQGGKYVFSKWIKPSPKLMVLTMPPNDKECVAASSVAARLRSPNSWGWTFSRWDDRRRCFYSCLKATMGSTLAACIAGYNPKIMPIVMLMNSGNRTPSNVMIVVMPEK
jgi:hypothetical protein